jgi:GDPmannose 4,6-dehydratase
VAKAYAHFLTVNYRESYGLYAVSGILFNHESPRRGVEFVSRKITDGAARIKLGLTKELRMGNLDAERDWGYAGDYVRAMWMMLQNDDPEDFVISTGETHSVEEFLVQAFLCAGLGEWKGKVEIDSALNRPLEVDALRGMSGKARESLGWKPKINFSSLVKDMVESDMDLHARPVRNRSR